jgi:hypothetical protein
VSSDVVGATNLPRPGSTCLVAIFMGAQDPRWRDYNEIARSGRSACRGGRWTIVRRRQTIEDMVALETND